MADGGRPSVLMTVEQIRRAVPGGIGAYARGILSGLAALDTEGANAEGAPPSASPPASLPASGVDVTLYASRAPRLGAGEADPLRQFGLPVILSRLPGPLMTRAWDHRLLSAPPGFDIVHSVSLAFPPQPARRGGHAVITVHDLAWRRYPDATTKRGRKWHETSLRRAEHSEARLIVTSGFVAADLITDGVDEARITIVHGGSDHLAAPDEPATDATLRRLGVVGEFVLTVGTLEPRKNVQRLLEAYRLVRPTLPEPWPLLVVGPEGWGPALSRNLHQEGVTFAGGVSDGVLAGLYRRARAFAYVPLTEGYGLPPLEAMRLGTPSVVAREVPSVHDLDQTGEPAVRLVDPFDIEEIAAGLFSVLTDEALRADLSARGEAYSGARTWKAAAEAHLRLWTGLA
jgi:glycosyltransferase involved in cell wall biosynthesis